MLLCLCGQSGKCFCFIISSFHTFQGLPFHHGDILHVVNASDREWWQARKITLMPISTISPTIPARTPTSDSINSSVIGQSPLGIIPSSERIERRHRIRSKRVNFFTKVTVIGGGGSGSHGPYGGTSGVSLSTTAGGNTLNHAASLPPHPILAARTSAAGLGPASPSPPLNGTDTQSQSLPPHTTGILERSNTGR